MRENRNIMGMPAVLEIVDSNANKEIFEEVFSYLISVDEKFSTYKKNSEITIIFCNIQKRSIFKHLIC